MKMINENTEKDEKDTIYNVSKITRLCCGVVLLCCLVFSVVVVFLFFFFFFI